MSSVLLMGRCLTGDVECEKRNGEKEERKGGRQGKNQQEGREEGRKGRERVKEEAGRDVVVVGGGESVVGKLFGRLSVVWVLHLVLHLVFCTDL